jgi:sugar-specific transcriptional regulator TrmB
MEIVKKVQQIGFSRGESEIFIALLQKKEFTAPELAKITTVTRTKIYEVLQRLIRKGVCNENFKNGQKYYRSVNPETIFQRIISNYESDIEQMKKLFSEQQEKIVLKLQRKAAVQQKKLSAMEQKKVTVLEQKKLTALSLEKELTYLHNAGLNNFEKLDYIEVLTDLTQIKKRWNNFQKNTKREILVFTKPPYTSPLRNNIEVQYEALRKNKILDKCIYEYTGLNTEEKKELVDIIEEYQKIGEESRVTEELPMKLAISDETITMLALNDRVSMNPSITTIIVDHPNFARAQKAVFETYWNKAITVDEFKKTLDNIN